MLDSFFFRWRTLTRQQQIIAGTIITIFVAGLLFSGNLLSPSWWIAIAAMLLIAFPIHEFAHALMAVRLGDPTPRVQGRVTLDPRAHFDPYGAVLMMLTGFGWAKAVLWVPQNTRIDPRLATILVAAAGPVSNLVLAFIGMFVFVDVGMSGFWAQTLRTFISINIGLFVFNLFPVPPLDGSHILFAYLPWEYNYIRRYLTQYGFIGLIIISLAMPGLFRVPASLITQLLFALVNAIAG